MIMGGLRNISDFPLMSNRKNADFIGGNDKAIQRDVSGVAVGDDELSQFAFKASSYQRVGGEVVDCGLDRCDCILRGIRIFVS
jgi:hypothetical protein